MCTEVNTMTIEMLEEFINNVAFDTTKVKKPNIINYTMECARPFWFLNEKLSHISCDVDSHASAMKYFYEYFKNNIKWNSESIKYVNLYEYALNVLHIDINNEKDIYKIAARIISFYFGYDGSYDCCLYIKKTVDLDVNSAHNYHSRPVYTL